MTHGEELSSDMNQDPVVLTYLESVLMHRAAAASAGAAPSKSGPEAPARPGGAASVPRHPPAPSPPRAASTGSALNVKKARLLQGEAWDGAKRRKVAGGQEGRREEQSPQQPRNTLLASLLQSFSSSLQEQQRGLSPGSRASSPEQEDEEPRGCGRLDGRRAEEPRRGSPSVAAPRLSCSARLKAVASMVDKGSGTPSSPKPSAACSQLALLLSSDCQLQQYSRARSLEPSASQRLAAIASKKQAGGAPERPVAKSPSAPRDKAGRSPASPGAGSSLLMHLLNSPKSQAANGHGWVAGGEPGCRARSRQPACDREEGRGEPGPRFTCAPMDLSTKPRSCEPVSLQSSSLEQMTESLLFSWNPKGPGLKGPEIKQDEENCPEAKSHHKVTLLQLLLGHHGGTKGSLTPELSADAPPPAPLCRRSSLLEPFPPPSSRPEKIPSQQPRSTPSSRLSPADSAARTFPEPGDPSRKTPLQSPAAAEPAKAHRFLEQPLACESPRAAPFPKPLFALELRQGSPAAPLTGDDRLSNFSFSASKLLHDLAHTGSHKSPEPSPMDSELRGALEPKLVKDCAGHPLGFQVSDPGAGQERATLQPVSGRAAPDLDHLLERRSVLQLLLRSPEKERVARGRREEQLAPEERRGGAESIPVVRVKTEPIESGAFFNAEQSARCQRAASGEAPENCLPLDIVKQEVVSPRPPPLPAPSHSVSRGGVLSQLLLRDSSGPMDNYLPRGQPGLEAPSAHPNPCPVARVRHLHLGSPTELRDLQKKPMALNGHAFCSNGLAEPAVGARASCKALEGQCGHDGAGAEPRGYLKNAQGFNVLKQLLLSENGIKVLSQHRTLQNGGSPGHSAKVPGINPGPFHRERELRRNGKESPVDVELARYPGGIRLPQAQRGTQPEPPWLTKANPILYYMLQRGGGEAPPFGISAPRAGEGEAAARKERKRPPQRWEAERRDGPGWVKEEPVEPLPCFVSHRTQPPPSPGQILEKVGAIKREPD